MKTVLTRSRVDSNHCKALNERIASREGTKLSGHERSFGSDLN